MDILRNSSKNKQWDPLGLIPTFLIQGIECMECSYLDIYKGSNFASVALSIRFMRVIKHSYGKVVYCINNASGGVCSVMCIM